MLTANLSRHFSFDTFWLRSFALANFFAFRFYLLKSNFLSRTQSHNTQPKRGVARKTTYSNSDPTITAIMNTGVSGEHSLDLKEGSISQEKHSTVTVSHNEASAVDGTDSGNVQANDDPNPKIKCSICFCPQIF